MRITKQSQSAEKLKRGDPLGFLKLQFAAKYQKKLERETQKLIKKSHSAEKNQRRDPIVSSGLVSDVKNGVDERGTLCINLDAFPLAGPVV